MAVVTVTQTKKSTHYMLYILIAVAILALWQRKYIKKWAQMVKAMLDSNAQMPPSSKFMWEYDKCDPQKLNYNLPIQAGLTDSCEVGALQELLNSYANSSLVVNGNYDQATENVLIATGIGTDARTLTQYSFLLKKLQ